MISQIPAYAGQAANYLIAKNPTKLIASGTVICAAAGIEMVGRAFYNAYEIGYLNDRGDRATRNFSRNFFGSIAFLAFATNIGKGLLIPYFGVSIPLSLIGAGIITINAVTTTPSEDQLLVTKGIQAFEPMITPVLESLGNMAVNIIKGLWNIFSGVIECLFNIIYSVCSALSSLLGAVIPQSAEAWLAIGAIALICLTL